MTKINSFARVAVLGVGLLAMTACSNLDDTQQKVLSGGAAGAVIGTVGVAITGGCIPCGTAIGGAVGAGTGYALQKLDLNTKSDTPANNYSAPASSTGYPSGNSSYTAPSASTPRGDTSSAY